MFPSKSDIVLRSFERVVEHVDSFLVETPFKNAYTYFADLRSFLDLIATVNARYSTPMIDDLRSADESLHERITSFQRRHLNDRLKEILQQGVALSCVRSDVPVDVMAVVFTTAVQFLLHPDNVPGGSPVDKPTPTTVFSTLFDGILVR